ncbi:mutS protein homolog 4 isoform X2 [Nomia melanderi]|uniref:mutS protein homolog 4 isoform X2 n=1 Tax=Nomia melanderi TaxID=2448451 RepID=UPI003FCE74A2
MNVMQTDKLFPPPKERSRNEARPREFNVPFLPNCRPTSNANFGLTTKWKSVSSNCSKRTDQRRNAARTRTSLSSSALPGSSRNYVPRSTTKSTTAVGSSVPESRGVIVAMTSGRGDARAEVGIAAMGVHCPHLILCQISDSQTYTNTLSKLYLFDPIQVLMPDTMCERVASRNILSRSIMEKFPETQLTPISRVHFNDTVGLERVRTLCAPEYSSVELFVKQKYYALAATAALVKYVEYSQRIVYSPKSVRIEFQGSPNAISIDLESARSLELVQSQCGQRNVSLLGVLDRCSTPMGRKLLRANILQPSCEECVIVDRQTAIAELVSNRALRTLLQPILRRLYGADRLAALSVVPVFHDNNVQCAEQNLNYVLLLKNMLDVVPELEAALSSAETDLLRKIRKRLENPRFRLMKERILETIHPDARSVSGYTSSNMQRCFAIKAGINDLLDVARRTYCELIDDMKTMVENLASKHKLPLSLGCNASDGYHIQAILPRNSTTETFQLPMEFIEVRKSKRICMMTTSALATLSQQCKISSEELHLMSNVLLCDLLQAAREHISCFFQLSTDVAELDVLSSLARASALHAYVRPTFGTKLELLDSRHPVLEVFGLDDPVPNNVSASVPWNFHVISGPNMSGKSTYLKQIVLLHIMAQIGCFVPAKRAAFRITDLIFCKIAVRDDIACNASTFALEMKEAQYILRSITPTSLVILDELCKGTAVEEGVSIAWAICERLLDSTAFIFAATHFAHLTKLAHLYCNVTNHYFETTSVQETSSDSGSPPRFLYTHRLKSGMASHADDYGIVLAELSGLPKSLTENARKYASKRAIADQIMGESSSWEHTCYRIVVEMYQLLERGEFHPEKITSQMERIAKLRIENANRDNEMEVQQTTSNVVTVNVDKRMEGTISKDSTCGTSWMNSLKQHTVDKIQTYEKNDFKGASLSNRTGVEQAQAENVQFQNNATSNLNGNDLDDSCRRPSNSFSSLSSYLLRTERFSNNMQGCSTPFNNMESQCIDKRVGNDSNFMANDTALSFSITRDLLPMEMSMLTNASTRLYEYCLSDFDFEKSDVFSGSSELVITSDAPTNL